MSVSCDGWANKNGTAARTCSCGSWKKHWLNEAKQAWPDTCSVEGCSSAPVLGAHVYHADIDGERIIPVCDSCNKLSSKFSLKGGIMIPSANKNTCAA